MKCCLCKRDGATGHSGDAEEADVDPGDVDEPELLF